MRLPGRDIPWKKFLSTLYREWNRDAASDLAGAVTFYAVLALFPFLVFLLGLASLVITPEQVETLIGQLGAVAPQAVTQIVGERLRALATGDHTGLLTFGGVGALWAASSGIAAVMRALNTAYDVDEGRPFWKVRGIALLMTIGLAVLVIVSTAIMVVGPSIAESIGGPIGTAITWLRLPVAVLLMLLAWALAYYVLPDVEQDFKFITPGSIVGVAVWAAASWGFSVYVRNFGNYDATYGSIGAVIVLLMWLWISSQVLLLGAEINAVIEHMSEEGKEPGAKSLADKGSGEKGAAGRAAPSREPRRAPAKTHVPGRAAIGAATAAFLATFLVSRARRA